MSLISAELTKEIYFSCNSQIKNDFSFEIKYSIDNVLSSNEVIKSIDKNDTLTICINGLEKLFKKNDDLNKFAKALNAIHHEKGWNVSYNEDDLVITHSADILEKDFSILFNTHYEFTKDFKDNDSILVKVYSYLPTSIKNPIRQNLSIKVYELPRIESVTVTNSNNVKTSSIIKGCKANIQWKTNVVTPHQGSAILYDENKIEQKKNEISIDEDRKFTLVVTKHDKESSQDIPIKAIYIEKLEILDSNNKSVNEIIKGESVKINYSLSHSDEITKVCLLDEANTEINPNEIIIDRDRTFTLKVIQGDDTLSEKISIKAVSIDKLEALNSDGESVQVIYKGEKVKINWSLINGDNATVSLLDEDGNIESDEIIIDRDRSLTLKVELNGKIATETITIFKTLWKKGKNDINIPFKPDEKSNSKIIKFTDFTEEYNGYYAYIHPTLYYSKDLTEWNKTSVTINISESFKYYVFKTDIRRMCSTLFEMIFSYTDKVTHFSFDIDATGFRCTGGPEFSKDLFREKDWQFLFTKTMGDWRESIYTFFVSENSVHPYKDLWNKLPGLDFPKNIKIISIDLICVGLNENEKRFMAILCNDNHIYVYEITINTHIEFRWDCINIFELEKKDQKKVTLVKADSFYVVTENYVFELNGNKDLSETRFSPLDTTKENQGTMIVGPKDDKTFAAIVQDGDKAFLWTYG